MLSNIVILSIAGLVSGTAAIILLYLAFRPRRQQKPTIRPRVQPRAGKGQHADKPTVPSASEAPTEPPVLPSMETNKPIPLSATVEPSIEPGPKEQHEGDASWDDLLEKLERYKTDYPESGVSPASAYKKDGQRISKSQLKRLIKRLEDVDQQEPGPVGPPPEDAP